jgi:hypothetical protein
MYGEMKIVDASLWLEFNRLMEQEALNGLKSLDFARLTTNKPGLKRRYAVLHSELTELLDSARAEISKIENSPSLAETKKP